MTKWPEIQYVKAADGMLDPVLEFPKQPGGNIGKYGNMRKEYLMKYRRACYDMMCQKIEELKRFKKGCMEKMFPRKGQKVPEKRFPGFTGDWEQRKLGDISDSYSGGTPTVGVKEYYGGTIPFIRSAEIDSDSTELYITEEAPRNCIEYVVMHELCHFIHSNHSKHFYAFLTMLMPDWKDRKQFLDKTEAYWL